MRKNLDDCDIYTRSHIEGGLIICAWLADGLLERFTPVNDELCSAYQVRAIKRKQNTWHSSNDFCIRISEFTIFSITGRAFSNETICEPFDDK